MDNCNFYLIISEDEIVRCEKHKDHSGDHSGHDVVGEKYTWNDFDQHSMEGV